MLEQSKCEVFTWSGCLPVGTPRGMTRAGARVDGRWEVGLLVYGVPVGSDVYVAHMLDQKVQELASKAEKLCGILEGESQALWSCLRLSLQQQFDYWLTLVHPSQVQAAAGRVDKVLRGVLEQVAGFKIPQSEDGLCYTCPMTAGVEGLHGVSFQSVLTGLPVKSGGLGLRSQVQLSPAAWIGGLEQALPYFGGEKGVCPALGELGGADKDSLDRWQPLLESGLPTGKELQAAWDSMAKQARQMSEFLEEEFSGPLAVPAAGAGQGSCSGGTRMAVVRQLEALRLQTMAKSLKEHPDRESRPVWSWPNRDKNTTAWLLSIPGPHTALSTPIFREGLTMVLCLPSPACVDRVGEKLGDRRVDKFGDALRCQALAGDGWRIRHDRLKVELRSMMDWVGMVATCEVTGIWAPLLPRDALEREEVQKARQVLIPDFRVELPATTGLSTAGRALAPGQTETRLAELKYYCGKSLYKPGVRQRTFQRAVDARAVEIREEYKETADKMDGFLGDEVGYGRCRRRLDQFGELICLVAGSFNELSEDTLVLVDSMAASRISKLARTAGLQNKRFEEEKGMVEGQLRRWVSTASLRAAMACMLDRVHQIGEGAALISKRREEAMTMERRMDSERETQWLAKVRGTNILRKGHIYLS